MKTSKNPAFYLEKATNNSYHVDIDSQIKTKAEGKIGTCLL